MQRMRLKHIATVDFRYNERSLFDELKKKTPAVRAMARDEVVMMRSRTGEQLVFVHAEMVIDVRGTERTVLHSERLRLSTRAPWNPLMLANYAEEAGIELVGVKRFEEHIADVVVSLAKELGVKPPARAAKMSRAARGKTVPR